MSRLRRKRRAPDHRWQEAGLMFRGSKTPRPGTRVKETVAVLASEAPYWGWKPKRLETAVTQAIGLFGADDPAEKNTLEGWLLTGLLMEQVAARTGLPVDAVTAYAALFLDVAGRLGDADAREDLGWELFGDTALWGFPESDRRSWKLYFGLFGGEYVLEVYLDYLRACPVVVPGDLTCLSDAALKRLRMFLYFRLATLGDQTDWTDAQKVRFEVVLARKQYLGL